jgi:hypothetical protein
MSRNPLLQRLQSEARNDYANVTPAFAYVISQHHKGLRLEAPDLALEFSNGIPLGRGFSQRFKACCPS